MKATVVITCVKTSVPYHLPKFKVLFLHYDIAKSKAKTYVRSRHSVASNVVVSLPGAGFTRFAPYTSL